MAVRMATWIDGVDYAAQDWRLAIAALMPSDGTPLGIGSGVRSGDPEALQVTAKATASMDLEVNPGVAAIQGTESGNQGPYFVCVDAKDKVTIEAADPGNARKDVVALVVKDTGDNKSTTKLLVVKGTPAANPDRPTLPANALPLAEVTVKAGTKAITRDDVLSLRQFQVGQGPAYFEAGFYGTGYGINPNTWQQLTYNEVRATGGGVAELAAGGSVAIKRTGLYLASLRGGMYQGAVGNRTYQIGLFLGGPGVGAAWLFAGQDMYGTAEATASDTRMVYLTKGQVFAATARVLGGGALGTASCLTLLKLF